MKLFSRILFLSILLLSFKINNAQTFFAPKKYPTSSYAYPVKIPISLAGNFGECRPNHFHSGLDIRTNKVENIPIYNIADGFISRIKIEAGGFGNAIYITHAGGYTSLYAHLNKFFPELEAFVQAKQYEQQSWRIDLQLLPHQFPIRKGSFIAFSGNTGSSQAPHLHMEIRDAKSEKPLNGMLFYNSIVDTKAPVIKQLAVYDGNRSIYEQKPVMLPVSKKGAFYTPGKDTIKYNSNKIYFGIVADDYMENALGTLGVYETRVFVDGKPFFGWQLDNIGYEETRYMNAQADYKTKKDGSAWIQLCRQLPNDKLGIYKSYTDSKGVIDVGDNKPHEIKIQVLDTKGNTTTMRFFAKLNTETVRMAGNNEFVAGKKNKYEDANIQVSFNENSLYDHIYFQGDVRQSNSSISNIYKVHTGNVPLHDYVELKLKLKQGIVDKEKTKIAIVKLPYGKETSKKGKVAEVENGWAITKIREFGDYEIVKDITPPQITTFVKNNDNVAKLKRVAFTVKEETTNVQIFRGEIDGKWARFVQKGDVFYYELDEHFPAGPHTMTVKAYDENGNKAEMSLLLNR
jgi:murein DD-endopeptidase MepM/ murein hydrolase activator NlpD